MRAVTPYDVLLSYPDRTRPLITHYDGPDSRVELSVASTANAVAKAASLLRDGLGLAPGAVVSVDLPRHWQLPVWVLAALSVGATTGRGVRGPVDVRIVGPAGLARIVADRAPGAGTLGAGLVGADETPGADAAPGIGESGADESGAGEVLACSCDVFGLPVPGGVPPGVIDVGIEVRAYPDSFSPEPQAAAAALLVGGVAVPWAQVTPGGEPLPGVRLWVDEATSEATLLRAVAVEPLVVHGSVVIGVGLDAHQAARIRATEAVTERAGS